MTPKFLATRSPDGVPNVVPVITLCPALDAADTLIFGNFLLWKSIRNLERDQRVGIAVITEALDGWILKGDFVEFQRSGPYFDKIMSGDLLRYNAYTGIRNAGVIHMRDVTRHFTLSKLRVLTDFLLAKWAGRRARPVPEGATAVPFAAKDEFALMQAVKVLSFIDRDGYPLVLPVLSMQPADDHTFVCAEGLASDVLSALQPGTRVASCLITFDAVSYQVKGTWLGSERRLGAPIGFVGIEEVYAGGPPLPGVRVA
jgi:predicted pyridoxine 5'-phosphate oxidase superfamily flavin-nucleotide-binding protein